MKLQWILIALMSAGLAVAQEPPAPPPQPKDEARPEPPPDGARGEMRPPLPPPAGDRGDMRPPPPPLRDGEPGGPDGRGLDRRMPMRGAAPMDFEVALRREMGHHAEAFKEFAEPLKDRIELARKLYQEKRFEEGRDMLRGIAMQAREMNELKRRDPERFRQQQQMAEMERQTVELGQKIRRATDEDIKKAAATELKEVLTKLFDLRQQERERNLQQLEREVKEVREALEKRKAKRDEMIQRRFDQLTGKTELMEW
ncbi:MAG: hypothetical protein HZA88_03735 [Verrucomicrobia bacterium]|nr:hypothetical protein [Verrucomicrobiota bacterium]